MPIKTVLLTGASGFIGSHIRARLLAEKRFKLVSVVRNKSAFLATEREAVIQGDFYDPSVLKSIREPIDVIIHCAAIRGEQTIPEAEYEKVNVAGTEELLKFAKKNRIPRFIYLSSVGVLGTIPDPQPAEADQPPRPDGKYHRSKWQAEELVRRFHSQTLQTLILRPTITYGTGDDGFIYKLTELVTPRHFVFPLYPVKIHLLNVEVLADFIVKQLGNEHFSGESYIVADAQPVLLKAVVDLLARELCSKAYPKYLRVPGIVFMAAKWFVGKIGKI